MGYCTVEYLKTILPRSVTIGDATITTPTLTTNKADCIATRTAWRYINLATQYLDSRLRQIYVCPLKKIKSLETNLTVDATMGNSYINIYDSGQLNIDSTIRISDDLGSEIYTVNTIFDNDLTKVGITPNLSRSYLLTNNPIVYLLSYPDPMPLICAEISIGMLFDKLFSAQNSPDISNFGKTSRTQASNALDDILQGVIRLEGQDHTGRRFARSSIRDTISTTVEIQHSRDKEI